MEYIVDFIKILVITILIIIILEQNSAIVNNGNILGGDGRWTCYDEGDRRWCHKEL